MRIAVVEDDARDLAQIEALLVRAPRTSGARVECFPSAASFLQAFEPGRYDLLIFDCYLDSRPNGDTNAPAGALTGLDLARHVRAAKDAAPVLFATSSLDFAVDGYEVGALAYLVKPVTAERLDAALARVFPDAPETSSDDHLAVSLQLESTPHRRTVSVAVSDLRWCCSDGHYLELHVRSAAGDEVLRTRGGFQAFAAPLLARSDFLQCARGHVVNLAFVRSVEGTEFVLDNAERLPISRRQRAEAVTRWSDYVFAQMRTERAPGGSPTEAAPGAASGSAS